MCASTAALAASRPGASPGSPPSPGSPRPPGSRQGSPPASISTSRYSQDHKSSRRPASRPPLFSPRGRKRGGALATQRQSRPPCSKPACTACLWSGTARCAVQPAAATNCVCMLPVAVRQCFLRAGLRPRTQVLLQVRVHRRICGRAAKLAALARRQHLRRRALRSSRGAVDARCARACAAARGGGARASPLPGTTAAHQVRPAHSPKAARRRLQALPGVSPQ